MSDGAIAGDVARTEAEAAALGREPLVILAPLEGFLDDVGLGAGALHAAPIGDGHSNVTYALQRGAERLVLRRPPRGPLPPSAHDVLREARLLPALAEAGARVPEVLAVCEDATVIGAPFYVMRFIDGHVATDRLPSAFDAMSDRARIGEELVDALVELHAVDVKRHGLSGFGHPDGYLERQIRRFSGLLERNATRALPELERIGERLAATMPAASASTIVHGDFRLGNVMFARAAPPRLVAMLDWELAAVGDPLADIGYLTATWAAPGDRANPMNELSTVTQLPGFLTREGLAHRYAECTGRDMGALRWYQTLAVWKSAIFLEGSYRRYLAGSTTDRYFARLNEGVPALARLAGELVERG